MLIFAVDNREESIRLLLIKRKNHPFLGCWALPGGFVEMTESLRDAAARELEEETGVKGMYLEQLYTFGETGRDPRSRIISVAYMAVIDGSGLKVQAGDDAARRSGSGSAGKRREMRNGSVCGPRTQESAFPTGWRLKRTVNTGAVLCSM